MDASGTIPSAALRQAAIQGDERVCLQTREGQVPGVIFAGISRCDLAMWMTADESTTNLVIARSYAGAGRPGPVGRPEI